MFLPKYPGAQQLQAQHFAQKQTQKKIPMDHSYHLLSNLLIFGFKEPHVYLYRPSTEPQIPQRSVDLVNKANAEFQELPFSHAAIAALYLSFTGDCQVGRWVSLPHGENKEFMTRKGTISIEM